MTAFASLGILVVCAIAHATGATDAPSTCPPPETKCECPLTKDDSGCLACMCHEPVPPTSCPRVRCPVPKDNEECSVGDENGCQVCRCTHATAASMSTAMS
ncbi:uncharacterized protein LOC144135094 [Amblyomma americanum]|uniref:Secreted protein n=1 Tax=Amblyomma americanum TaxID=6943 RepID=A0AAQ4FLD3_AMBAM